MEAILYEIQLSGFSRKLRSGVVLTGGGANLANCGNFITEMSGYSVRTGYPRPLFSSGGCIGVHEAEAATSIGMILAAVKDDCEDCTVPETYAGGRTSVVVEPSGESTGTAAGEQEDAQSGTGTLFPEEDIRQTYHEPKKKQPKKPRKQKVSWKEKFQNAMDKFTGTLYDMNKEMNDEEI